VFLRR